MKYCVYVEYEYASEDGDYDPVCDTRVTVEARNAEEAVRLAKTSFIKDARSNGIIAVINDAFVICEEAFIE